MNSRDFEATAILVVTAIVCIIIVVGVRGEHKKTAACSAAIERRGYDVVAVRVFLKSLDLEECDFEASQGLRLQFDRFQAGQETVGRRRAGDKGRAESAGLATGLAIGISMQGAR